MSRIKDILNFKVLKLGKLNGRLCCHPGFAILLNTFCVVNTYLYNVILSKINIGYINKQNRRDLALVL